MENTIEIPEALIDILSRSERVAVLTGAGISAESGVPTFRDAQTGLWAKYRAEELATPQAFYRNPKLVWEWYTWRRNLIAEAKPNPGHRSLVIMEKRVPNFKLITQNVDGLHQLAGSEDVIELHGNINRNKCTRDGSIQIPDPGKEDIPPRCPICGAQLRPDVVWFGESLPEACLKRAWNAARNCQVFFSIGTSAVVQPAASLPLVAQECGAVVIEINPQETALSHQAEYTIAGPAGMVLPELLKKTWPEVLTNGYL